MLCRDSLVVRGRWYVHARTRPFLLGVLLVGDDGVSY
jgi:hypothetical protein